jgi:hypothetical protein
MHRNPFTVPNTGTPTEQMVAAARADLTAVGDLRACPAYLLGYIGHELPGLVGHLTDPDALAITTRITAHLIALQQLQADRAAFTYTREDPETDARPVPAHEGWHVGRYAA